MIFNSLRSLLRKRLKHSVVISRKKSAFNRVHTVCTLFYIKCTDFRHAVDIIATCVKCVL